VVNSYQKVFLVLQLIKTRPFLNKIVWVCNSFAEQELITKAFKLWSDIPVHPMSMIDKPYMSGDETRENNIEVSSSLTHLNSKEKFVLVCKSSELIRTYPSSEEMESKVLNISIEDKIDSVELFEGLIKIGYQIAEDNRLNKGQYLRQGDVLDLFIPSRDNPVRIEMEFDNIGEMYEYDLDSGEQLGKIDKLTINPLSFADAKTSLLEHIGKSGLFVEDELEIPDEEYDLLVEQTNKKSPRTSYLQFSSFMEESDYHHHLHFLSVLKYQNKLDMVSDIKEKISTNWRILFFTKHAQEIKAIFDDKDVKYIDIGDVDGSLPEYKVTFIELENKDLFPEGFQNPRLKTLILTDREVLDMKEGAKEHDIKQRVFSDFLTGLKVNDFVVHTDHGIARFLGLEKKTVDEVTREYLKLGYAENDKLFVPIDQADKVSKFIGFGDKTPKLTRLGSAEWQTMTSRVQKETEKIAEELLKLYAEREAAKGFVYENDKATQLDFEKSFPYQETPGQLRAVEDVKKDMESDRPMDRLVCGDVGFGKTEVAMRAAFKAVQSGKQVAFISPITILADQHYKSFKKRMDDFHIRVELFSRFKSQAEIKKSLKKLEDGEVDIAIGTHRLIQSDVKFKNLGLVMVDEEQRFGVKQKEALKEMRAEVDILTLTATPIPRTLNISLNGLRDITTITTPPPGRLPIITEVRRFSLNLIKEAVEREMERGGQIYFLHNRVQTIEDVAAKLRALVPKARIIVAHGKLTPQELEKRILSFKDHEFDILVSSTIIENGIDLANANTLIVNQADRFGLSQLYQLRGRVGRSKTQAYAYFLYHPQRLPLDAKKRLRAIVEASELGAGFQIAMKDLEIRGAGDILGASQSGAISTVGVSHFVRMLNNEVEKLKAGKKGKKAEEKLTEVSIELPVPAFIPDGYIVSSRDKISVYQKLAAVDDEEYLMRLRKEITEDYGAMPTEVINLFKVLDLKILAKNANIHLVKAENVHSDEDRQVVLGLSELVTPAHIFNLIQKNPNWLISGDRLKIKFKDLGLQWIEGLAEDLKTLSKKAKNLPGEKAEK